jgi:hypothetical protein
MTRQEMEAAFLRELGELLRPKGCRKRGPQFRRDCGEVVHLIQVQKSVAGTASLIRLTINLAVHVKELARRPEPSVWDAQWWERLGTFASPPGDRWWEIADAPSLAVAVAETHALLIQGGLPALEELQTTESPASLWRSGPQPGAHPGDAGPLSGRSGQTAAAGMTRVRLVGRTVCLRGRQPRGMPWLVERR